MGIRSIFSASSVVPETSTPSVSHEELVIRVNVLGQECARLSREIVRLTGALTEARQGAQVATNGPIPLSPELATSGRSLIRFIAVRTGKNEDTVRHNLTRSAAFTSLRDKAPDLTTNVAILRWLALPAKNTTELRYSLILGGFNTPQDLVREMGA